MSSSWYEGFQVETDPFVLEADLEVSLDEKWISLAKHLINENNDKKKELIAQFRTLIEADDFLKNQEGENLRRDSYLTRFLRAGNWNPTNSLEVLRAYSSLGGEYTKYVSRAIPTRLDDVWKSHINTMTEKRDKYGRRIYIFRLGHWDPDTVSLEDFYASAYVLLEMVAREVKTQIAGITVINDVSGFGFRHLRCLGLEQMKCIIAFMNGAFPIWFRRLHIVNNPRLFGVLYNIAKPFLTDRVTENIVFHGSNLSTLHEEVGREMLPHSLGGTAGHQLDNRAAVEAAKKLDDYFQNHVQNILSQLQEK